MQHDDSNINSLNISSNIGSTTRIRILFPHDYEDWALDFDDYVLGSEDSGYLIWEAITVGPFCHTKTKRTIKNQKEYNQMLLDMKDVRQDQKEKIINNVKAMRIIIFSLWVDTFCLVSSCDTTKNI